VSGLADSTRDGFDAFYRREYLPSLRLAWLLTGSRAVAEDVVHDAMTAVYGSFGRVDAPSAYLRRAVVNTARSWQRDERRQRERATFLTPEAVPDVVVDDGDLLGAVGSLPYRQRVVIVARYWGGWSEAEIAQMLGCRPGTVKSLASRAINRLRREVHP
jgi:RNA polymerase sigma-70 factor (sigma-E family)